MSNTQKASRGGVADSCWSLCCWWCQRSCNSSWMLGILYRGIATAKLVIIGTLVQPFRICWKPWIWSGAVIWLVTSWPNHAWGANGALRPCRTRFACGRNSSDCRANDPIQVPGNWHRLWDGWAHKTLNGGLSCQYRHQFVIAKMVLWFLTNQGEEKGLNAL